MMRLLIGLCALLLTSCANMVNGTTQEVRFETPGVTGAECTVYNQRYHRWVIHPPETITLHKGGETLAIHCIKEGYTHVKTTQDEEIDGFTFGNAIFGPFAPFALFDDVTSGFYGAYDDVIRIPMERE